MNIDPLCVICIVQTLFLISAANAAPVLARKLFGWRFSQPIDNGIVLFDSRPLFGSSKTWRGFFSAVVLSAAIAPLLGSPITLGVGFGAVSIGADLLASFIKRRLGFEPSSRARLLDVFPEALLPALAFRSVLGLSYWDVLLTVLIFFILEASFSPLLFRLHIRNRPY